MNGKKVYQFATQEVPIVIDQKEKDRIVEEVGKFGILFQDFYFMTTRNAHEERAAELIFGWRPSI